MDSPSQFLGDSLFARSVSPADIAILIGLPMNQAEFRADLDRVASTPLDGRGDYAASLGRDPAVAWSQTGAEIARLAALLIDTAQAAGVPHGRLFPQASLDSITEAAEDGAQVIVIVAHWRSHEVRARDLSSDAAGRIAGLLRQPRSWLATALAEFLQPRLESGPLRSAQLADWLGDFIDGHIAPDEADPGRIRMVVRDALDVELAGLLAPGNAVEFRDGVHKPAVVATALPAGWSGLMDLAICHSLDLAIALRAGREDRRVLAGRHKRFPYRVVPELCEVLLRLAVRPQPYVALRSRVARDLSQLTERGPTC